MIIEYHRTHFNSHPPTRGNPSDAGLDVYFSPKAREPVTIEPGQSVILPTGLKFGVPHGYMLEVKNRSSVASKRSLIVGACVDRVARFAGLSSLTDRVDSFEYFASLRRDVRLLFLLARVHVAVPEALAHLGEFGGRWLGRAKNARRSHGVGFSLLENVVMFEFFPDHGCLGDFGNVHV